MSEDDQNHLMLSLNYLSSRVIALQAEVKRLRTMHTLNRTMNEKTMLRQCKNLEKARWEKESDERKERMRQASLRIQSIQYH